MKISWVSQVRVPSGLEVKRCDPSKEAQDLSLGMDLTVPYGDEAPLNYYHQ